MSNVNVTEGSGKTIATSSIGGVEYQNVKPDIGGSSAALLQESGTAANLAAQVSTKSALVVLPGQWAETHAPAVNTQATKSHTAGAAGVRHVCTWLAIALANDSTGSVQTVLAFNLRDGATGAGTILASFTLALPATAGECRTLTLSGLNIVGSAATAMTLENAGTPATHTAASVAFGGYSTPSA